MTDQESAVAANATEFGQVNDVAKNPSLVFEIGAFDGGDIPTIRARWAGAVIHAFEPDPDNFKLAQAHAGPTVIVNQLALSNKVGTATFYQVHDTKIADQAAREFWFKTAGSLHRNGALHYGVRPTLAENPIEVQVTTLDAYCGDRLRPDILLIDTQGCEYEILEGAAAILPTVKALLFEWSSQEVYQGVRYYDDIAALLTKFGFKLHQKWNAWQNFHGEAIWFRE